MQVDFIVTRRVLSGRQLPAEDVYQILTAVIDEPTVTAVIRKSSSSSWTPVRNSDELRNFFEQLAE